MIMVSFDPSGVLVDFASPFFPLGWRRGPSASVQWILDVAGVVWELTEAGASTAQILEALEAVGPVAPATAQMVDALVRRKTVLFAGDRVLRASSAHGSA